MRKEAVAVTSYQWQAHGGQQMAVHYCNVDVSWPPEWWPISGGGLGHAMACRFGTSIHMRLQMLSLGASAGQGTEHLG